MARINLLPWREALRKQRQKEFGLMVLAGVMFTGLAIFAAHLQIESQIAAQKTRNARLVKEIEVVEKQISEIRDLEKTKASLLARMNVIQELQRSRPEVVHMLDELVETLPEGVILEKVRQSGAKVELEGQAQSNARVSSFMRNIDDSQWIGEPQLVFIENNEKSGKDFSRFQLTTKQTSKVVEEEK